MKKQVFYVHGGDSYSSHDVFLNDLKARIPRDLPSLPKRSKWTETLRDDLGEAYEVFMPSMPNSQNAKYEEWKIWFERHFEYLDQSVILVGLSLGAMFLAKYLSNNDTPFDVSALILLAGAIETKDFEVDGCGDFLSNNDAMGPLAGKVKNIVIFHSKDDFVVPYEHALKYKAALPTAELVTFEDKNHFLITEFPELIDKIKSF